MTKEQEVVRCVFDAYIRDIKDVSDKDRPTYDMLEEVKNIAIKALEQQPSEDCVSRAEMLKYQQYLHGKMSNEENHKLWEFIKGLPPVTPTFPKGETNGDIIKAMFPCEEEECVNSIDHRIYYEGLDFLKGFNTDWWDAPYKRGDSDGRN